MHQHTPRSSLLVLVVAATLLAGCSGQAGRSTISVSLVERYSPEAIENEFHRLASRQERTEWRFDGPAPTPPVEEHPATWGWEAGHGVTGLAIRNGSLRGKTTADCSRRRCA